MGSSAFGLYEGDILFTRPDGTPGSCLAIRPDNAAHNWGLIQSIEEEKAGALPNMGGYSACEVTADASNEGIWEVTFLGPAPDSWRFSSPITAGTAWKQAMDVYTIAAWDITVRDNDGQVISGRAFAHHLPLNMGGAEAMLSSVLYILTKDGYQYRVDLNDATGHTVFIILPIHPDFK